ncbi:hypothetical protein Fmac_031392 [Flemingia macrophylla]|uniref:Beta-glucosidase n=1 Tax=Flemingia macrophylla TaxID=520843 RepID=A0ABD1L1Y5_9FABA
MMDSNDARVKHLLSVMTLQEKIGSVFSAPHSHNGSFEKAVSSDCADMVDEFQKLALESRLGIPIIYGVDAVHGNNSVYGATIFPHNVALGATRLVCRDPRWGRCYESYSENTEVVRKMTSFVLGLQGHPPDGHPRGYPFVAGRNNVVACAKHFVGDGVTEKGINEGNAILSYEDLERIHIAPYVDCIAKGVSTIMVSYSSWNGNKLHGHHFLLSEILKEKLGFKGFVISDWEGIDELCQPYGSDYRHCISTAINAGIDMVIVPFRYETFIEELMSLVQSGEIPIARIDDAVERILRVKFAAELFEFPLTDRSLLDIVGCKQHRDLACEAVRKSLVLLKNGKDSSKPFLPLNRYAKRILVVGTHANDMGYQCGGWTGTKYGSSGQITIGTTILDAVKEAVGNETLVIYEQCPSIDIIEHNKVSVAIVVIGEGPYAECGEQCLLEKIDALVAAWLPGTEGRGITDVIFGDHDFKGQLPMTWFRKVEQLDQPDDEVGSCDPLFPLGFALTYNKENLHD